MAPTTSPAVTGPLLTLNNGVKIPAFGFGTFAHDGSEGETHAAVLCALNAGYRHLDCAWFYQNEREVGSGVREFLASNPSVKREDIFICTKVWPHLMEPTDVEWSIKNSLEKLQTPYVDAFLLHWPFAVEKTEKDADGNYMPLIGADGMYVLKKDLTANLEPTWRAMEKLYSEGLAKSIGVSNWTESGLKSLLAYAKDPPAINQIEIHPFLPNTSLIKYCLSHNVLPVAYSPLGSQNQVPGTGEKVSTNPELNAIAEKRGASLAQVLIAWGLKRGYVVVPKSSNPKRIVNNAELISLSDEEFEAINKVAEGRCSRFVNMKDTFGHDVWPEESA